MGRFFQEIVRQFQRCPPFIPMIHSDMLSALIGGIPTAVPVAASCIGHLVVG